MAGVSFFACGGAPGSEAVMSGDRVEGDGGGDIDVEEDESSPLPHPHNRPERRRMNWIFLVMLRAPFKKHSPALVL